MKKNWNSDEDIVLAKVVRAADATDLKWNDIALELYIKSMNKFFRNGKQCRERWMNHLDDSIRHEKWTEEEDEKLVRRILQIGKKWSQIMKAFDNKRT